MSDNTPVQLLALHEGIKSGIREMFTTGEVPTVDYYSRVQRKVVVPAIFFEMTSISSDRELPTEQIDATFRFSAYCILPYNAENACVQVRILAAALASKLNGKRWGQPIGRAKVTVIEPDNFDAENYEYETVRIDWEQDCVLGNDVWAGGVRPTTVYLGIAPDTGVENIDKYQQIFPEIP